MGILSIPRDPANPIDFDELLEVHGNVSLEHLELVEQQYIDTDSRAAQDTHNLYRCLMASISTEAQAKVYVWSAQYTIDDFRSGILFLKIIIRESHLDRNATSSQI